jgi:hypothetical protein
VGNDSDVRLAIRTIAVSARAAIDSSKKGGRPDAAAACAQRGLALLEGLRDRLGADVPDDITQQLEAATRELASAARGSLGDARASPKSDAEPGGGSGALS